MMTKDTFSRFRIFQRETPISNEDVVSPVTLEGLPDLSTWKKLFVDMPRRSAIATIAGVALGGGNVLRQSPSLYSAIIGLGTFAAVYVWSGSEQNLPK